LLFRTFGVARQNCFTTSNNVPLRSELCNGRQEIR
jgi:hypothetical protein